MRIRDFAYCMISGASFGVLLVGGQILQQEDIIPLAITCQEDEPCWDSRTMGNQSQGQEEPDDMFPEDSTVCRWDGEKWLWAYSPIAALDIPCPFNY